MLRLGHVETHMNGDIDVHVCMRCVYIYAHAYEQIQP